MVDPKKRLTALERQALKRAVERGKITGPRRAPKAPKPAARPVYKRPPGPPNPPGFGKTPPKAPRGSIQRARQAVPLTRAGKALQAANLSGLSHPAASRALARATAGLTIGGAILAYDAYKALDAYSKTSGPEKQMAKYKAKGGFSHMTSNPKKRGKQGLDF